MSGEYENVRRVSYGSDKEGWGYFVPVCEKCLRFVKAPKTMRFTIDGPPVPKQATCSKCGPTDMLFEGYY